MPHFVYMLRCQNNRIYTGYAVDVKARFLEHAKGTGAKFTKAFAPISILKIFELNNYKEALRLEARIKKLPKQKKEILALGNVALEKELLSGLFETLAEKRRRINCEKRTQKSA